MPTIPASQLVSVVPSVLGAGGDGIDVIGLVLTTNTRVPIGTVQSFPSAESVDDYFGPNTTEARIAGGASGLGAGYFGSFTGATKLPAAILFAQYNEDDVPAYLRSGDMSGLTLAELQAITGSLNIVVDGYARNAASVNLSAATSFSNAATIIETALNAALTTIATITTAAIAGNVLTVTTVASGTIAVGQTINGAGVDTGLQIIALGTGTGGAGTYTLSGTDTVSSEAMTTTGTAVVVTYDSVSGGFIITSGVDVGAASTIAFATGTISTTLKMTSATGALLSQGATAATPAGFMNDLINVNSNWVTFFTAFDPDGGSGNTLKEAFAAWTNGALNGNRFAYICWDTDITPTATVPAADSLGQILEDNDYSGTCLIYDEIDLNLAAFMSGTAASIDFTQRNGRISFAFRSQEGLVASVTDPVIAVNLGGNPQVADSFGNGYNFYGAYGTANPDFTWFQRGLVSGPFRWFDSYINQIWMNNAFQVAILNLFSTARSIPYSTAGISMIQAALTDPIQAALNFGAFGPGTLSQSQKAAVDASAGLRISDTLQAQGYYLQILPATAAVRAARTSPPATFWYIDNGSVQSFNLASVALS